MMKFYGAPICRNCVETHALLQAQGIAYEYVDITASVANLRAFLALRDSRPEFAQIKAEGRIGIPVFELDNGELRMDEEWLKAGGCAGC